MKAFCLLLGTVLLCPEGVAQLVFSVTNLPSRIGVDYYRAYIATADIDVSGLLGTTGGPRRWDFSEPQRPDEVVRHTDVVAASDGGHGGNFSAATYAERATDESRSQRDWSYYRLVTNSARRYYGFFNVNANPDCPAKIFVTPTSELPDSLHYGQSWTRTVDFSDCLSVFGFLFELDVHFTSRARVDAWGTVVLPNLGEFPTLRLNEENTYDVRDADNGVSYGTTTYRNFYWLVRGIGKAVHILSPGYTGTSAPATFTTAKTYLRAFDSNTARDYLGPRPVTDIRIRRQGEWAILTWRQETNAIAYRVETVDNLSSTNWQLIAEPSVNTWSNILSTTAAQRYFRVFFKQ